MQKRRIEKEAAADIDLIKSSLSYCEKTGRIKWACRLSPRIKIGDIAGYVNNCGYIVIEINKQAHTAHRIAWLMHYGKWPEGEIDHINHVRDDNRIDNLRVVNRAGNAKNLSPYKNSMGAPMGVYWDRNASKWHAQICVNKKNRYIGIYSEWWDAVCARKSAENKYNFHPNHGNRV